MSLAGYREKPASGRSRKSTHGAPLPRRDKGLPHESPAPRAKEEIMSTTKERTEALDRLREHVQPGDLLDVRVKHVSRSGMYRVVDVAIHLPAPERGPRAVDSLWLSYNAAVATGHRYDRNHEGVGVPGCGFSATFEVVYSMARALFPDGFGCLGESCPSNDHSNGDRDRTPHATALERECPGCQGTGKTTIPRWGDTPARKETCRTCGGEKRLAAGHWHREGGYALRER